MPPPSGGGGIKSNLGLNLQAATMPGCNSRHWQSASVHDGELIDSDNSALLSLGSPDWIGIQI